MIFVDLIFFDILGVGMGRAYYRIDSHVMGFKHVPFAVGLDDPLFFLSRATSWGTMAPWHGCMLASRSSIKNFRGFFNLRISMCSSIFSGSPFTGTRLVGLVVCFLRIWHFARSLLRGPVESETSPQPLSVTPKLLVIK